MKKIVAMLLALTLVLGAAVAFAAFPEKNMTLIVPWNAGGSSDLIGRLLTAEMAQDLGVKVSVVNTPGATGTVGMNDCLLAPHDGYTLIANATPYSHGVMGLADWSPRDWDFFAAYYVPGIIAVKAGSEYDTFDKLYEAIKAGAVSCGTAGLGSTGYGNMCVLSSLDPAFNPATGAYKHVPYSGGAAAVTAVISGEVDFTPQLSNEMIDYLRSGDMVALATLTADDLTLDGVDYTIPSIKNFIPETADLLPCGDAFGLLFPSDVPQEAKDALEASYLKACQSEAAKTFAAEKGVILVSYTLEESNALRDQAAHDVGWILYDTGAGVNTPEQYGYPR